MPRRNFSTFLKGKSRTDLRVPSPSGSQHSAIDSGGTGGVQSGRNSLAPPQSVGFFKQVISGWRKSPKNSTPPVGELEHPPVAESQLTCIAGVNHIPIAVATGSFVESTQNVSHSSNQTPGLSLPSSSVKGNVDPQSDREKEFSKENHVPPCDPLSRKSTTGPQAMPLLETSSLWVRTLDLAEAKLIKHGLPALDRNTLTSTSATENIQSIIGTINIAQEGDGKEGDEELRSVRRERLRRILRGVEKYTKIVDIAVQHSPEVTALVWAGIRGILQISLNHLEAIECLEETMQTIMEKITMCEFYGGIYADSTISVLLHGTLHSALPKLYASVIALSIKTREYFHARWIKKIGNMLKPFDIEFGPFIDEINACEKTIRELADGATMERIRQMEGQISDIKTEIQSLVKINQEIATKATENPAMIKEIHTTVRDEKTYDLLKDLSPLEPLKRHEDIRLTRAKNTGMWLLQLDSFCNWSNTTLVQGTERVFCCYGIPGAGKTVMSSHVIDDLNSRVFETSKVGVACLYSDYRDKDAQTLVHIIGSFLQQFLGIALLSIPKEVLEILEKMRNSNRKLSKDDLLALLKTTLHYLECAFICIDALDELEAKTRTHLLQAIIDLSTTHKNIRVFLTGRKHIQDEVQKQFKVSKDHEVEIAAHSSDIQEYLRREIADDNNPDAMDETLENEINLSLGKQSQKMFLLPALHIKVVLGMPTKSQRRKALQTLPQDLYETFAAVIDRIKNSPPGRAQLGMRALMWLHLAYRPFHLEELQHALSVETGQTGLDVDNIPTRKTILECCLGLVILDEETKTIRFVHYTLEEYFRDRGNDCFPEGCSIAGEICLTYLNFGDVTPHCTDPDQLRKRMEDFPFVKYAAVNWGFYVARHCDDTIRNLTLKLLEQFGRTSCPLQVLYYHVADNRDYTPDYGAASKVATTLSGFHIVAYFGLVEFVQCLYSTAGLGDDDTNRTPLSWAAEKGHESVVRLLLARDDVDVNTGDDVDQTPLSLAAKNGHESVVRLLLARDDVDVNTKDDGNQTPLSWAARNGHESVVRLLLARDDVDVNTGNYRNQTPLSLAAKNGHESVVRLLLARDDVDVNTGDYRNRTPLSWAAENGHESVVRLLLARDDVDVNTGDYRNQTPLSWAAENGHESVVRLLLARDDVDVNTKDDEYRTPLSWAAENGHESVVRLLLARDDVDVNTGDYRNWTPLSRAAKNGHESVVRLLLARDDVDINAKSKTGKTAVDFARKRGYNAIVELLSSKKVLG